ncbi:hypothetical protein C8J56DRAFT_896925 [Mycena floridula]|nr:hypothetical protein C8J56DRAFT_896925 [Mycena floridula]
MPWSSHNDDSSQQFRQRCSLFSKPSIINIQSSPKKLENQRHADIPAIIGRMGVFSNERLKRWYSFDSRRLSFCQDRITKYFRRRDRLLPPEFLPGIIAPMIVDD